jgi:hypothetical protein
MEILKNLILNDKTKGIIAIVAAITMYLTLVRSESQI